MAKGTLSKAYQLKLKFERCLNQAARAGTPGEAQAAEDAARRIMTEHDINPCEFPDEGVSFSGHRNFGRFEFLQTLRMEYIQAHPPKPDELVWAIDETRSIPEAVAYTAGEYSLVPILIHEPRGHDRVGYRVYCGDQVIAYDQLSFSAKERAETHNKPANRKARAKKLAKDIAESEALMASLREHPLDLGDFGKDVDEIAAKAEVEPEWSAERKAQYEEAWPLLTAEEQELLATWRKKHFDSRPASAPKSAPKSEPPKPKPRPSNQPLSTVEYGSLQTAYDHFNRELFDGKLPHVPAAVPVAISVPSGLLNATARFAISTPR
jgi:hypothetical protein